MSKLRTSKYKHTVGKEYKREEWYQELRTGNLGGDTNGIAASAKWVAFPAQGGGGSLHILSLKETGKKGGDVPSIIAHSAPITDFKFCPWNDDVVATGSEDALVKVWKIPEDGLKENLQECTMELPGHGKRIEWLEWHPTAADILASMSGDGTIAIWNTKTGEKVRELTGFGDQPQCFGWSHDGTLIAATCKDKKVRVFDVRAQSVVSEGAGHEGVKATRVLFLGKSGLIITTGFNKQRMREMFVYAGNDVTKVAKSFSIDSSTGVLMPLYDDDTCLLFVAGKGDGPVRSFEVTEKSPFLVECTKVNSQNLQVGVCLVPKRAVDVMQCEVARVLKCCRTEIVPVMYQVPRKTYSEYHPDLFPDTRGTTPGQSAEEWLAGGNADVPLVDLTPAVTCTYAAVSSAPKEEAPKVKITSNKWGSGNSKWGGAAASGGGKKWGAAPKTEGASSGGNALDQFRPEKDEEEKPAMRKIVVPKVVRKSKFRHIHTKATKSEEWYTDVKPSGSLPVEASMLQANSRYLAVPWAGAAGQIMIIPLDRVGKVPVDHPTIAYTSEFTDCAFDPFNDHKIATATDSGHVLVWTFPEGGLTEPIKEPLKDLTGHSRRVVLVEYHPSAANVLASGSADQTIILWNLDSGEATVRLEGLTGLPSSVSFDPTGARLAVACKDKHLRVYDARKAGGPIQDVAAHDGAKAFSIGWASKEEIITAGFSKTSVRELKKWAANGLDKGPVHSRELALASGIAILHVDDDLGVVYMAGKGDGNIQAFEINDSGIHDVSPYTSNQPQNALAMLPKAQSCNVRECEIAKFAKLSIDSIQLLTVTVPRTKSEFFQDDIYPPTRSNVPALTAAEFFAGSDPSPKLVSLKPDDMIAMKDAPKEEKKMRTEVATEIVPEDSRSAKDKIMESFNAKMDENAGDALPQDANEGVEAEEWAD